MHIDTPEPKSIQCPHCNTRFRVKAEQLLIADGLVRCSVCMNIFSGIDEDDDISPALLTDIVDGSPDKATQESDAEALPPEELDLNADSSDEDSPLSGQPPEIDLLAGLSTVNHDFEHHIPTRRRIEWIWLAANTVVLCLLIAQIGLWQKSALFASSMGEQLKALCHLHPLFCEDTPSKRGSSVTDVISTKLVVRKHPSSTNALMVDTILLNRGPSSTTFPRLQLRFSDINNQTVASRSFKPEEYLAGELASNALLASQQPVHIALEIVDPGPAATSYQLTLTP